MNRLPVASTSHGARRIIQFGIGRRAPVAGEATGIRFRRVTVARHRGDNPVGVHFADALFSVNPR